MDKQVKKCRLLIVDDDVDLLAQLKIYFQSKGYDVFMAINGRLAIDFCNKMLPDIIILDLKLPDMSGFNVFESLQSQTRTKQIPVIVLTVSDDELDKKRAEQFGAHHFIHKPVNIEQLALMVRTILTSRQEVSINNPVSSLPAQYFTDICIEELVHQKDWTLLELHIDFKEGIGSANREDYYDLLTYFAHILNKAVADFGTPDDFIGQMADENFVMILHGINVFELISDVNQRFEQEVKGLFAFYKDSFYEKSADQEEGLSLSIGVVYHNQETFTTAEQLKRAVREARLLHQLKQKSSYFGSKNDLENWFSSFYAWTFIGFELSWPHNPTHLASVKHILIDKLVAIFNHFLLTHGSPSDWLIPYGPNQYIIITQNPELADKTHHIVTQFKSFIFQRWGTQYGNIAHLSLPTLNVMQTKHMYANVKKDVDKIGGYLFGEESGRKKRTLHEVMLWGDSVHKKSPDWHKVRRLMDMHFNLDELDLLCFEMGIEKQEIRGEKLSVRSMGVVEHCFRYGRTFDLLMHCQQLRPNVAWLE